ncbi:MAG: peptidoglycan DD-metalloendopeptidase family protein [Janthinobacterium lividum]
MIKAFSSIVLLLLTSSCANQEPAPVEFNKAAISTSSKPSVTITRKKITTRTIVIPEDKKITIKPLADTKEYKDTQGKLKEPQSLQEEALPPLPRNVKVIYHEAQEGETLADIARDYSASLNELVKMNEDLTPDANLREMQIVKVPVSSDILNRKNKENSEISKEKNKEKNVAIGDAILIDRSKYINPLEGIIIANFNEVINNNKSAGISIAAKKGTPVKSIIDGTVTRVGSSQKYGNLIITKADNSNLNVAYAHLENIILENDQKISQGQVIGSVGDSGNVDMPQLYMAIKDGDKAVNPLLYIPGF